LQGCDYISLHGISPDETAVFGDDTPDFDLFTQFKNCIAMGNAHESLKKRAAFITKTNSDGGLNLHLQSI
jgi:hydroxymethylpyrimidine pyrophosphatase-like HAD family hydrolase